MRNDLSSAWLSTRLYLLRFLSIVILAIVTLISSAQTATQHHESLFQRPKSLRPVSIFPRFNTVESSISSPVLIHADTVTIFSASAPGCCPCFCPGALMSPSPVTYRLPRSFFLTGLTVDNEDTSCNNHSGFGNLRAQISDVDGNLIANSRNTLYGESGIHDFTFAFDGELIPQNFKLSLVIVDGIQACGNFTVRNLRFFEDITPVVTQLKQFNPNTLVAIPETAQTVENPVAFGATVRGFPYNAKLQVELRPFNQLFTNTPNLESQLVASGSTVSITAGILADGQYHWQARTIDSQGNASQWQEFGATGNTDFVVKTTQTFPQVYADTITVFSASNPSSSGCCPSFVMPPSPVTYHLPNSFFITGLTVNNDDFSNNNRDGLGNIRAWIFDINGNTIASSTNTLWGQSGSHDFTFAFSGQLIPRDFKLSLIIDDSLQGGASFTVRNLRFLGNPPPECVLPVSGLVGWWPSDGNTIDTVGNNGGTLQNGASFAPGKVNQAFSLDGIDDYINVPNSAPLTLGSQFTIELWFKPAVTIDPLIPQAHVLLGKGYFNSIGFANNDGRFEIRAGDTPRLYSVTNTWFTDTWYHVAVTFDSVGYTLYVNGIQQATLVNSYSILNNTNDFTMGGIFSPGLDSGFFSGLIDELSIYNRALTPSEVLGIFNAGNAGKCALTQSSDLSITMAASSNSVITGSNVTYTIHLANKGPATATSVAVTDNLGANISFQLLTAPPGWNCTTPPVGSNGTITCTIPALPPNATETFTVLAKVSCLVEGQAIINNIAHVSGDTVDPFANNNSATTTVSASNTLPVIICPSDVVAVTSRPDENSAVVNYPLPTVTDNCTGVTVSCTPPPGFMFLVGTTVVSCRATDSAHAFADCTFTVTVNRCACPKPSEPIRLKRMWQEGDYWKPETYIDHHKKGPDYAADFYYTSTVDGTIRNRPDLFRNGELGVEGRHILAPHEGRAFLYLDDITNESKNREDGTEKHFTPIDAMGVINGSLEPPKNSFWINDKKGNRREIDIELVIVSGNFRTLYAHLSILGTFFNSGVQDEMRMAISDFYNGKVSSRPIDTGQVVSSGTLIGSINHWGLARQPHLHFNVFKGADLREFSTPLDLSDPTQVLLENQPILDKDLKSETLFQYPAMIRRRFAPNQMVVATTVWDGIAKVNVYNDNWNVVDVVPEGTLGQVISEIRIARRSNKSSYHVWWKVQFVGLPAPGWIAAEYLAPSQH